MSEGGRVECGVERTCRENVLGIQPYVPGKPIDECRRELGIEHFVKLASNENAFGASPAAHAAMAAALGECHMYPDGGSYMLSHALARHLDLSADHFLIGCGSAEILNMLAETVLDEGDELVYGWPSFGTYVFMGELMRARSVQVPLQDYIFDLDTMLDAVGPRTKMVIICNPNNPTGTVVGAGAVERFLDRMPDDVLVVLDEAYAEYADGFDYPDGRRFILEGRNVIALRTFSKAYGLAGTRIGYSIARPALTEAVNKVRQPFNVSSIAQAGALAALGDQEHLRASVRFSVAGREQLYEAFTALELPYVRSWTNFVLVDVGRDGEQVFQELLKRGVIVRPQGSCGLPSHLRVTVGTLEENRTFVNALSAVLGVG